jgi:proline iminopeptidase
VGLVTGLWARREAGSRHDLDSSKALISFPLPAGLSRDGQAQAHIAGPSFGQVGNFLDVHEGFAKVRGLRLFYRSFGKSKAPTVLGIAGGPGSSHDYLSPLTDLVQFGYRVVLFDQRGCGRSSKPKGARHYTEQAAIDEVEGLRRRMAVGRVHLFGHSYGGLLALDVALRFPQSYRSLTVCSGGPSSELIGQEYHRLFRRMPTWVRDDVAMYRARGDFGNPKYRKAMDQFLRRHYCRLNPWPSDWRRSLEGQRAVDYDRMKGWDVTPRLSEIGMPCLLTVGRFDVMTPRCSQALHRGIRDSKLALFRKSSHLAFWEERDRYTQTFRRFLDFVE